jgi:AraC family transcriptional regulator
MAGGISRKIPRWRMADSDGSGAGTPTLITPAVQAVFSRLSIQHLPLTIIENELKGEQRRFSPLAAERGSARNPYLTVRRKNSVPGRRVRLHAALRGTMTSRRPEWRVIGMPDQSAAFKGGAVPQLDIGLQFDAVADSLASLLETVRLELDRDREAAKASLVAASSILQSEIERRSFSHSAKPGALTSWQTARLQAFIDENLHRRIVVRDLSAVAQRSPAHFSRSFKKTFGEPPHAYVVRRRLERARLYMVATSEPLSEIALSVGLADQAHFCRLFRRAFGQSPSTWRRERKVPEQSPAADLASSRSRVLRNTRRPQAML